MRREGFRGGASSMIGGLRAKGQLGARCAESEGLVERDLGRGMKGV